MTKPVTTATRELLRSHNQSQGRFYTWGEYKYASVTSILSAGLPKPFLMPWAKKLTAQYAVDNLALLNQIAENDPQGAVDWLKGATDRSTARKADLGSLLHEAAEDIAMGKTVEFDDVDPDIRSMLKQFGQFVEVVEPNFVAVEAVIYNPEHRYAGTLDMILETSHEGIMRQYGLDRPVRLLVDIKTSKDVYAETALQLAAYRYGSFIGLADGSEREMMEVDGGAVLNIKPRSWRLVPIECGEDVFKAFLRAAGVAHWAWEGSKGVVGAPLVVGKVLG